MIQSQHLCFLILKTDYSSQARNIFATLLHEIGPSEPAKGYAQLTRRNGFCFT